MEESTKTTIEEQTLRATLSHISSVSDLIVDIKECPSDMELMAKIGQLYNGAMGTVAFQKKDRNGFDALYQAIALIENTCRLYEAPGFSEVDEEHILFVERCGRFVNNLISELLERKFDDSHWEGLAKLAEDYAFLSDVRDRENLGQDDVDKLLGDL